MARLEFLEAQNHEYALSVLVKLSTNRLTWQNCVCMYAVYDTVKHFDAYSGS